jgi:hypothetical protein
MQLPGHRAARTAVVFATALVLARGALAQSPTAPPNPLGVWRGTSICLVRPSPCNDEIDVYRITRANAGNGLSIDARRIVKGKEEEMGVLDCSFAAPAAQLTCTMPNGVWRFTIRGDSLAGELRLPDNTKYREVRASRSH